MQKNIRPFGFRDKLGYLFGDFGNDFTFILSTSILMKFYTDVMGLSSALVGVVMMLARFLDAVTDVTMGAIADRSEPTAAGKFKPWILKMALPVAIASFLMYQSSLSGMPYGFRVAYFVITYLLWGSFCYTGINIPYGSMASAISPEPSDRQSLSTYRSMGGTLAGLVIGVGLPVFAYSKVTLSDGTVKETLIGSRVTLIAGIFSVLAVVCYLLCYALVRERVQYTPAKAKKRSVRQMALQAIRNRALISIIAASVLMLLAQLTMQNMSAYLFPDYYNNASAQSVSTLLMVLGMLLAAAVAKPLAGRFGKAEVSAVSTLAASMVCFVTFLIKPASVWVYCGLQFFNWLGLGMFSMVSWALITDVIDDAQLRNGIREDGSVYALYSFARKLGQAAASGLSGFFLQRIGYNNNAIVQGVAQTQSVKDGIFTIATLLPAVGFGALALVLWFWYPLHKRQVEENVKRLREKSEGK